MTTPQVDPEAFKAFEQAACSQPATPYNDLLGAVTTQATAPLLGTVRTGPDVRLLDIATGPGEAVGAAGHP
jgi:hypothetical protein